MSRGGRRGERESGVADEKQKKREEEEGGRGRRITSEN